MSVGKPDTQVPVEGPILKTTELHTELPPQTSFVNGIKTTAKPLATKTIRHDR